MARKAAKKAAKKATKKAVKKSTKKKAKKPKKAKKTKKRKAKRVSKIAKGKRAKNAVFKGRKEKTASGHKKSDLMKNKSGKVVTKKSHAAGVKAYKRISGWVAAVAKARKARGAKLVVIDPYRTGTAEQADLHLAVKPGTDGALAAAVIHLLLAEGLAEG